MIDKNIVSKLRRFYQLFGKSDRKSFYLLIFIMSIGALLEIINIGILTAFAGLISGNDDYTKYLPSVIRNYYSSATFKESIVYGAILVAVASLIKNGYLIFVVYIQKTLLMKHLNVISEKLFKAYLYAPYDFYMDTNSSIVISHLRREVPNLVINVINSVLNIILGSIVLFFIVVFMFIFQPLITTYVMIVSGVAYFLFIYLTKESIHKYSISSQKQEKSIVRIIQESFSAFIEVRLNNLEDRQLNIFKKSVSIQSYANKYVYFLTGSINHIFEFTFTMIMIFSIVLLIYVSSMDEILPVIIFLIYSIMRIKTYASTISNSYSKMLNGIVAVDPVCNDLDMKKITTESQNSLKKELSLQDCISVESISYAHSNSESIKLIDNVSLKINKGDSIGLVGKTGSGKTTLANIIAGLIQLNKGQIRVDGLDIKSNYHSWYKQISYVQQDVYIIDDTIKANIAFGEYKDNVNDEVLAEVIRCADLTNFIDQLEDGLDTVVGERGARLSGGQRQRIAIARALYKKPALLILDEATSALDIETENRIISNLHLFAIDNNLTQVIVAHKKSSLIYCNALYYIDSGEITKIDSIDEFDLN